MSSLTMEDAREAKRRAEERRRGVAGYYGIVEGTDKQPTEKDPRREPADPPKVDHYTRRETRLAHPSFDAERLPAFLVECGCGECHDRYDPLADEVTGAFSDVMTRDEYAREECDQPRPMTLERAREAYLRYQRAAYNSGMTSVLEDTETRHGKILGAERDLLERYDDDVTVIFLSLRLSPVEYQNGERRWIEPVKLDQHLHGGWQNVYETMKYHLGAFDYEYFAITTTTTSAATPHTHVVIWVDDPDDEVHIGMAESMVGSHVNNVRGAYDKDHPVEEGKSDAGIVFHDPPRVSFDGVDDETLGEIASHNEVGERVYRNTVPTYYAANQQPHWVLKNVYDAESDINSDSPLVDDGPIAMAAPHDWIKSSDGIDVTVG
jgi:hypothetical protein